MPQYPRIRTGIGKLTPELWARIMTALQWVEQVGPRVQLKGHDRTGGVPRVPVGVRLYRVLDAEVISDNRWSYGWERVALSDDAFVLVPEQPTHESEGFGRALNVEEANSTAATFGYGSPTSAPQANIVVEPLATGSIVPGLLLRDDEAEVLKPVLMPASNPLAVSCIEPPP